MSTIKLTPAIKHLLTLRSPNVLPSPPLTQLNKVFAKTLWDAKIKKAETGWLVATTCTLLTANRPSAVGHLYRFVTRSTLDDNGTQNDTQVDIPAAVNKAALIRESALKSVIFIGVPRVILSLTALHEVLEDEVKHALRSHSRRTADSDSITSIVTKGMTLWKSIYQPHADKLHDKLGSYHPDFIFHRGSCDSFEFRSNLSPEELSFTDILPGHPAFIIQSYGSVLSPLSGGTKAYSDTSSPEDLDQGNLSRALGSVVGIASLRAEGGVGPQLTSHIFGLLKARNTENQTEEDKWLSSDEGTEWVLRTVDEVLDGVSSEDLHDQQVKVKL